MVNDPADYAWSSYRENIDRCDMSSQIVTKHPIYLALGRTARQRADRYRSWVRQGLAASEALEIAEATRRAWPLGGATFHSRIESLVKTTVARNRWGGDRRSSGAGNVQGI